MNILTVLGSMTKSDVRCICEIKSRIAMTSNIQQEEDLTSKLDFNLRKKLVKCDIWSIALYGAETWTL